MIWVTIVPILFAVAFLLLGPALVTRRQAEVTARRTLRAAQEHRWRDERR